MIIRLNNAVVTHFLNHYFIRGLICGLYTNTTYF